MCASLSASMLTVHADTEFYILYIHTYILAHTRPNFLSDAHVLIPFLSLVFKVVYR